MIFVSVFSESEVSKNLEAESNATETTEEPHEKFTLTQAEVESSMKMYDVSYIYMNINKGIIFFQHSTSQHLFKFVDITLQRKKKGYRI